MLLHAWFSTSRRRWGGFEETKSQKDQGFDDFRGLFSVFDISIMPFNLTTRFRIMDPIHCALRRSAHEMGVVLSLDEVKHTSLSSHVQFQRRLFFSQPQEGLYYLKETLHSIRNSLRSDRYRSSRLASRRMAAYLHPSTTARDEKYYRGNILD